MNADDEREFREFVAARSKSLLHTAYLLTGDWEQGRDLLQTALAIFVFHGWGLGLWNSVGPVGEMALSVILFVFVQLPVSVAWLKRFRYGPVEYVWRRLTYGRLGG